MCRYGPFPSSQQVLLDSTIDRVSLKNQESRKVQGRYKNPSSNILNCRAHENYTSSSLLLLAPPNTWLLNLTILSSTFEAYPITWWVLFSPVRLRVHFWHNAYGSQRYYSYHNMTKTKFFFTCCYTLPKSAISRVPYLNKLHIIHWPHPCKSSR